MQKIDADRGYHMKKVEGQPMYVFMYIDTPGEYYNALGGKVPLDIARKAGFPVDDHIKIKARRERLAQAQQQIESELALSEAAEGGPRVLAEGDGYKLLEMSLGRGQIVDDAGNSLFAYPVALAEAKVMMQHLVPGVELAGKVDPDEDAMQPATADPKKPAAVKAASGSK